MPSMIFEDEDIMRGVYMLPPILYPDGKHYLKLGGDLVDLPLENFDAVGKWFRQGHNDANYNYLIETMKRLVPSLEIGAIHRVTCVTSYTPTRYPALGWTEAPNIAVMTGGCGAAAKSSDEIGRLGSDLLVNGAITDTVYSADFAPRFLAG
jgi:sarcosine oxidase